MKIITAVIQPEKLTDVKYALLEAKIGKLTVSNVIGAGQQMGYTEVKEVIRIRTGEKGNAAIG